MDAWVEWRAVQRRASGFFQLMRLDKPVGTFLLLWPLLWAMWLVADGAPPAPVFWVFLAGTVVMRSAGCVINDFADRRFDPFVKRTRARPLAARRVSPRESLVLFGGLMVVALLLVMTLDLRTVLWSLGGAVLTVLYPFTKRVFPVPQFWLGAAFGWAVPMACVALTGEVGRLGWLLFVVTLLWAAVYDTEYAMVDRDDDLRLGVRSSAIWFGEMDTLAIGIMQAMVVVGLYLAGRSTGAGLAYNLGLVVAALMFARQQWLIRDREREACFRAFRENGWLGAAVFAALLVDYQWR
ncbi:MAG: hypothetical protein RL026_1548 [Pseudomonadota bacterium]|jgi:4-hydroxybenzoate polyprenyltransferase